MRIDEELRIDEQRSVAAGLFLLVRPLGFLGFERWLERHPRDAAEGYGWALLRAIAERRRIPDDDPIWRRLWLRPGAPPDTTAWRVALDRLLRRRCGIGLSAVVKRAGWLSGGATALAVRFPEDAADLRLRRMAFDVDPGFVPWLGLDVVYRYQNRTAP